MKLKETAEKLKTDIPAVYLALKRADTPIMAKIMAVLTVGYALSPIDLIPDFIPVLGYIDDLIILPLLAALTIKLIPTDIMYSCRKEAEGLWSGDKPKKWYCGVPIVLVWVLITALIVRMLLKR